MKKTDIIYSFFVLVVIGFTAIWIPAYSQPIEIEHAIFEPEGYCTPGVKNKSPGKGLLFSYGIPLNSNFYDRYRANSKVASYEILKFKIKVPVLLKPRTKILIGFNYLIDEYNFEYLRRTENLITEPDVAYETMRNSSLNFNFFRALNNQNYLAVRASISTNGDFQQLMNFSKRYAIYKLGVIYGIKKSEQTEWAFGIAATNGFRGNSIYPFAIYNRTFNDKWGLETILPVSIFARYNISPGSLLRGGVLFNSKSYSLDARTGRGEEVAYNMNRMDLNFQLEYQRQISGWVWFIGEAGLNLGLRNRFEQPDDRRDFFNVGAQSGIYGKIGIFLTPPPRNCD